MDDDAQQHDDARQHDDVEQASDGSDDPEELAEAISEAAGTSGRRVAVVESLTGGLVSSDLAASPGSSEWFRGGVVAYDRVTKHGVLQVPGGPVVAEPAVRAMAESAATMFDADLVVAVSGAGGPDPQDDQPPGTVWGSGRPRRHHDVGVPLRRRARGGAPPHPARGAAGTAGSPDGLVITPRPAPSSGAGASCPTVVG